jgi:hypothetical protein
MFLNYHHLFFFILFFILNLSYFFIFLYLSFLYHLCIFISKASHFLHLLLHFLIQQSILEFLDHLPHYAMELYLRPHDLLDAIIVYFITLDHLVFSAVGLYLRHHNLNILEAMTVDHLLFFSVGLYLRNLEAMIL